tara:strand:+ start:1242 stop:1589 length:348 start_codon:yes stop_codon:yes gene_type:complete
VEISRRKSDGLHLTARAAHCGLLVLTKEYLFFHIPCGRLSFRLQATLVITSPPHYSQLSGLSGSGKSTIASALEQVIVQKYKTHAFRLDGDNIRFGLNKNLVRDAVKDGRKYALD